MKARSKLHREVLELSSTLPVLNKRDMDDARRAFAQVFVGKRSAWCGCCGKVWESDLWDRGRKKHETCPHCGAKGKIVRSAAKIVNKGKYYVTFVRRCGDWQVIRVALCERSIRKEDRVWGDVQNEWWCSEVYQRWMKPGVVPVIVGLTVHGLTGYICDVWNCNSRWEIRQEHYRYELEGDVCGKVELLPIVRRNGLTKIQDDCSVRGQLFRIMNEPKAEILMKGGQRALMRYMISTGPVEIERLWAPIRVAMRNGYIIRDVSLWIDMVDALSRCGKDTRNPHHICPSDLRKAHDEAMDMDDRRLDRLARQKAEEERLKSARSVLNDADKQTSYEKKVGRWLGVRIKEKDIEIRPLRTIQEFFEEGEAMHHCVFKNKYYERSRTLVLTARVKGIRQETIELDTKTWSVIQCRGKHNQDSRYHDQILRVLGKNMDKLRKAL